MLKNDLLLRAAARERTERTPVWLMRQAGRADPEYVRLRERVGLPLEKIFRDADLAAEISLLPKRWGVDAIIFFQDILTPLAPMGAPFVFRPGPLLIAPIRTSTDVAVLREYDVGAELGFVSRTIKLVKESLDGELPLLGFAGAPLTLAFFLIEGRSPGRPAQPRRTPGRLRGRPYHELEHARTDARTAPGARARAFMRDDPAAFQRLLDRLTEMTVDYLGLQIEAGADAVQLFESFADLVSAGEYEEFAQPYHERIFSRLGGRVPTILFVKEPPGAPAVEPTQPAFPARNVESLTRLMAASGADVLSVGASVDLSKAVRCFGHKVAFQGNVDNRLVAEGPFEAIDDAVHRCIRAAGQRGHILNLNHGLLENTPFENVRRFVETAKSTRVGENKEALQGSI